MSTASPLAYFLRLLAALLFVATLATWISTGAHRGWTRTHLTEMQHDEVTGIDFPVEHRKFVAGVEILAAGVGLAAALGLGGHLLSRRGRRALDGNVR